MALTWHDILHRLLHQHTVWDQRIEDSDRTTCKAVLIGIRTMDGPEVGKAVELLKERLKKVS